MIGAIGGIGEIVKATFDKGPLDKTRPDTGKRV
jgi:hypothetical protein